MTNVHCPLIMSNTAPEPFSQKIDMYIVYVGDEDHPPRERIRYRYWGCVQRWLFEHCYIDEPFATAEKGRVGRFHAVVRERFSSAGMEHVVISQNKHWQYSLDGRAGKWSIIWTNVGGIAIPFKIAGMRANAGHEE